MIVLGWGRETIWLLVVLTMWGEVRSLSGSNVCMVQQKYNVTKRVKYRAPMSVRSYVWCFSIPPRCSTWKTEMRDLTRLETEERNAEVAVCCPGYKMRDITCIPICPNGKTGRGCTEDCPPNKWGPNCVHECKKCRNGLCSPITGECDCLEGWQGESCQTRMSTTPATTALAEELLTTTKSSIQTLASIKPNESTSKSTTPISSTTNFVTQSIIATSSKSTTMKPTVSTTTTRATTALTTTVSSTSPLITTTRNPYYNVTLPLQTTLWTKIQGTTESPKTLIKTNVYNRTETPVLDLKGTLATLLPQHVPTNMMNSITTKIPSTITSKKSTTIATKRVKTTIHTITENESTTLEAKTTKKTTTVKSFPSTIKLKTKEIWIKPTQKGETPIIETKHKALEAPYTRIKGAINKNELPTEVTTPKTIIVSIIPTSISHASFKKIALTTVPYNMSNKNNVTTTFFKRTGITKAIDSQTSTALPYTIKILHSIKERKLNVSESNRSLINENINKSIISSKKHLKGHTSETFNISTAKALFNTTIATSRTTNSMSTTNEASGIKLNLSTLLTHKPLTNHKPRNNTLEITTASSSQRQQYTKEHNYKTQNANKLTYKVSVTKTIADVRTTKIPVTKNAVNENTTAKNVLKKFNSPTTKEPIEDETFHILTEPEHITAVMTDKEREHTSVDLISVVSIAGGVMMAVITVAVVIVMVERCRRPRYDDVRKMDEMRMQSMIDSDDEPPPYVRSIFHTPLPEPPSEKCHYQPITTLDRNLKQFMRPVVVQTISPVMLENFRGILECHYDHLPRRSHDFEVPLRSSITPSTNYSDELRPLSVADTIEALKCEAKFDVIDSTTSEPLYAEIPCWRPPSEHAIEVNLNGEAVTEL